MNPMLRRLWWKEFRLLWPIALAVALLALGSGWVISQFVETHHARNGVLTPLALGAVALFAFAAASAAFAGEREAGTLDLLDALPVDRGLLWFGKATFAAGSTFGLALMFTMVAELYTDRTMLKGVGDSPTPFLGVAANYALLLCEALAWGLLWSAVARTALTAALLSLASVAVAFLLGMTQFDANMEIVALDGGFVRSALVRSVLALGALAASRAVLTRGHRPERAAMDPRPSSAPALRPPGGVAPAWSGMTAFRRLLWATWRESRRTWLILGGVIFASWLLAVLLGYGVRAALPIICGLVAFLAAGVVAFGVENRGGTARFHLQHGVRPGLIWLAKVLPVLALATGVCLIVITYALLWFASGPAGSPLRSGPWRQEATSRAIAFFATYVAVVLGPFAVGVLSGQVIRRGITAGVVGLVGCLVCFVPLGLLVLAGMIPIASLVLVPPALLGISWAWTGDWVAERPGFGRWARLGIFVAIPFTALMGLYIAHRGWSVPDVGPIAAPAARPALAPGQDAAPLYEEAVRKLGESEVGGMEMMMGGSGGMMSSMMAGEAPPPPDPMVAVPPPSTGDNAIVAPPPVLPEGDAAFVQPPPADDAEPARRLLRDEALALAIRAADLPGANFPSDPPSTQSAGTMGTTWRQGLSTLTTALIRDAAERRERGDLAGAWRDLVAIPKMARHAGSSGPMIGRTLGSALEQPAIPAMIAWAFDPRQTPELLRAARDAILALPPGPFEDNLRAEAAYDEWAVDRPLADLQAGLGSNQAAILSEGPIAWFVYEAPWERERARRISRELISWGIAQRIDFSGLTKTLALDEPDAPLYRNYQTSPLARLALANSAGQLMGLANGESRRRALILVLALRAWQLSHSGTYPDRLEELVPSELAELPRDPTNGQRYRYGVGYQRPEGEAGMSGMMGGIPPSGLSVPSAQRWSLSTPLSVAPLELPDVTPKP